MIRTLMIASLIVILNACSTSQVKEALTDEYDESPFDEAVPYVVSAAEVPPSILTIHFLDIGTGSCHLIDCPGDDVILNDCGEAGTSAEKKDKAIDEINRIRNGRKINLVLSHPDSDHFSLINRIAASAVKKIYYGDAWDKYGDLPSKWGTAILKDNDKPYEMNFHANPYSRLTCGPARIGILTVNAKANPADPGKNKNGNSLVLYVEMNKFSAILSGDAEEETENAVINNYKELKPVTIVSGSHHGAKSHGSNSQQWIKKVNPNIVVFSANSDNTLFGHPRKEIILRYVANSNRLLKTFPHSTTCGIGNRKVEPCNLDSAIFSTFNHGNISIETDGVNYSLRCSKNNQDCSLLNKLE